MSDMAAEGNERKQPFELEVEDGSENFRDAGLRAIDQFEAMRAKVANVRKGAGVDSPRRQKKDFGTLHSIRPARQTDFQL